MELNAERSGDNGLCHVGGEDRPALGFGNSSSDKCLSTAWLKIQAGGKPGQAQGTYLGQRPRPDSFLNCGP